MTDKINYLPVGVFTRTHGVQGALILRLQEADAEDIREKEWAFVEIDGLRVPFFITGIRDLNDEKLVVIFDKVNTEARAKQLTGCQLMIATRTADRKSSDSRIADLPGYTVVDAHAGEIGKVKELLHINENPVLVITGDKEILIPYHPDIIVEVSSVKKLIRVKLPDGLLDI